MVKRVNPSIRAFLLPAVRPVWIRVWIRIETFIRAAESRLNASIHALEARVTVQEARITAQEARLAALDGAWRQNVPAFLNAVASVEAFAHQLARLRDQTNTRLENDSASIAALWQKLNSTTAELGQKLDELRFHSTTRLDNDDASIAALWERIEFIRREILFELSHNSKTTISDEAVPPASRVVKTDKLSAARDAGFLRLNLGCGHLSLPDYLNTDMRELPGVDVIAEVGDLPFEAESVDEIYSAHLLEHFPQERLSRRLLPHWFSLLKPGGIFRAVTPDAAAMLSQASSGSYTFDDFREAVFGTQDYIGDYHYNLLTPDSLRHLLETTGFIDIDIPVSGRRNGKCFEFEITARRP